jgi:hypothetical protein
MSSGPPPLNLLPPITFEQIGSLLLIIFGSTIEMVPKTYHVVLSNPMIFIIGMFVSAGLTACNRIILAFAVAFFLVNLLRIMPKSKSNKTVEINHPGVKEAFKPSGAIEWVTNNKKWFVEKVLKEKPIGIQAKELDTYPVQA